MPSIEVDFDVFKALTALRPSEEVSDNEVLRELLKLPPKSPAAVSSADPTPGEWVTKGVRFPAGTQFRAKYKGQMYLARVEGGALAFNGKLFDTPSKAAMAITTTPVNGWTFWECRLPGKSTWQMIKTLRSSGKDIFDWFDSGGGQCEEIAEGVWVKSRPVVLGSSEPNKKIRKALPHKNRNG
jgi:hypothetical protein